ncbi:hypothetical protein J7E99_30475 [Streptomyces sp. ISL-44]|uniref:hypothetical protein n=1 Tax=unclassified Streptomyces TaxID=2593676 RepID=UPI001BE6547D|nr:MULTISPECIES: hypothetical protein [unclassified Streptomyces]MBT2544917.1 hypothetical protein [Streptomyces sp. ISL-44]MCX5606084.1 hypothetical protein [Streptomyces sp. NBC_00047]UUU40343.1 hypothetical protein JIW86_16910 [Streptomyces sp. NBC_00162]
MARHAASHTSTLRSAGLTLSMAGAALAMAAGGAQAGELDVPAALAGVTDPIANLKVNPLAHTGVDPLDNGIATKVADFPAVGTGMVTGVLTQGPSVGELPTAAVTSLLGPVLPK